MLWKIIDHAHYVLLAFAVLFIVGGIAGWTPVPLVNPYVSLGLSWFYWWATIEKFRDMKAKRDFANARRRLAEDALEQARHRIMTMGGRFP